MIESLSIQEFAFSVFHAHYSENVKGRNQLVMENLRDQEYKVRNWKYFISKEYRVITCMYIHKFKSIYMSIDH